MTLITGYDGPYLSVLDEDHLRSQLIQIKKGPGGYYLTREILDTAECTFQCVVDNADHDTFSVTVKPFATIEINPSTYDAPAKILAISDIEGNFNALYSLLVRHEVMDQNYNWTFGTNALVILGDLMDRGENVTQCLWLVFKLEALAREHGGRVHFLLGNHELMNLESDLRFAHEKYSSIEKIITGKDNAQEAHRDFMHNNSFLLDWVKSKNSIERIGSTLFVHAGISPELLFLELSLQQINSYVRHYLKGGASTDSHQIELITGDLGPLWYRGMVMSHDTYGYNKVPELFVDEVLSFYKANRLVIGHTVVGQVSEDFHGKLIRADVLHSTEKFSDSTQGLLIEEANLYRAYGSGKVGELVQESEIIPENN